YSWPGSYSALLRTSERGYVSLTRLLRLSGGCALKTGRRWEPDLDDERSRRSIRKARCRSCGGAGTISILSDQLTAYQLAEPEAEQAALCVLVKTKEPKIEWHVAVRSCDDLAKFLAKADHIAHEIAAGHFYKRPGKWCSWCDF